MRDSSSIAIAAPATLRDRAEQLLDALACADWPIGGPVRVTVSLLEHPRQAAEEALALDAIVMLHGPSFDLDLVMLTDRAASDVVPVVHLGGEPTPACGQLQLGAEASPETIVAALAGLLARSCDLDRLEREAALAQRVADGVEAEITRRDEELQAAALLQQEFLPRLPLTVEHLTFAALWRPASSVSGDIFDIFRLSEHCVGIFLADAVGHGVPAALQAMMLCRSIDVSTSGDAQAAPRAPADALARLNDAMVDRQGRIGRYAAAIYAVIDCRTRVVRVANAGSPPPIVVSPHQTTTLDATGALLGIVPGQTYDEVEITLLPGESLCFHSDGLEEAFPSDAALADAITIPRHIEILSHLRDVDGAEEAIELLSERIDHERGSLHQRDDCTVVLVRAEAASDQARRAA